MQQLARRLSGSCAISCLNLPLVDRTGIDGAWDLTLDRVCAQSDCDTEATVLEKIGLKVEKTTAPVERLVVDHIDQTPTGN